MVGAPALAQLFSELLEDGDGPAGFVHRFDRITGLKRPAAAHQDCAESDGHVRGPLTAESLLKSFIEVDGQAEVLRCSDQVACLVARRTAVPIGIGQRVSGSRRPLVAESLSQRFVGTDGPPKVVDSSHQIATLLAADVTPERLTYRVILASLD